MPEKKKTFECQYCQKVYIIKSYFDKHVARCEDIEMEIFNYEGLIEEWKGIDPDIAHAFEVELKQLLEEN